MSLFEPAKKQPTQPLSHEQWQESVMVAREGDENVVGSTWCWWFIHFGVTVYFMGVFSLHWMSLLSCNLWKELNPYRYGSSIWSVSFLCFRQSLKLATVAPTKLHSDLVLEISTGSADSMKTVTFRQCTLCGKLGYTTDMAKRMIQCDIRTFTYQERIMSRIVTSVQFL